MRSLNKSLPQSSQVQLPPEELLLAFKNAATSVTKLYKQAHTEVCKAHQSGYQEAIEDLLTFLDRKRLGLGDGEGWEVRKWATERLDGPGPANANESEEEKEVVRKAQSPSPVTRSSAPPESSPTVRRRSSVSRSPPRTATTASSTQFGPHQHPATSKPEIFTFQANHPFPQDSDMQTLDTVPELSPQPMVRVEVHPRATRQSPRQSNRHAPRGLATRSLGHGAGVKRKIPYGDFFDVNGVMDAREWQTSALKRPRGQ